MEVFKLKSKAFFASANTFSGFVSYYKYVINKSERVYILQGGLGSWKSEFIKKLGEDLKDCGFNVDFIYSSWDVGDIDAIFIEDIKVCVVDGTYNKIEERYPGAFERTLNFDEYYDIDYLRDNKEKIIYYTDRLFEEYDKYYKCMKEAKHIHDILESEYLIGMDFKKADSYTYEIINKLIKGKTDKKPEETHRFLGAMGPKGQVSFYDELTSNIANRYIIKGRPGTGKSTLMKKTGAAALISGYNVEYYHCSFDPDSIDMIIIPEISSAILDGTAPHVVEPQVRDNVIDMFSCINTDLVKEDEEPILSIWAEYKGQIEMAKGKLAYIYELREELKRYYGKATDSNMVNALRIRIENTLIQMK